MDTEIEIVIVIEIEQGNVEQGNVERRTGNWGSENLAGMGFSRG